MREGKTKIYEFKIVVRGRGKTAEEAWVAASRTVAEDGLFPFEKDTPYEVKDDWEEN